MPEWTFTFADILTREELGTFPLTGVKLARHLSQPGSMGGFLSLLDPAVRKNNPWAGSKPRRTALYVEYDDRCVWGGPIWARGRKASSTGYALTGATWESWLVHRLLRSDLTGTNRSAAQMITDLVARLQAEPYGNVGMQVVAEEPGVGRDRAWLALDLKTAMDLVTSYTKTNTPIEFRVDCSRSGDGWLITLIIGEPTLGRALADTQIELAYPHGALWDWSETEDGTAADNALFGVGAVPSGAPTGTVKPSAYRTAADVGSDELGSGFPLLERGVAYSNQTSAAAVQDVTDAELLQGLNTTGVLDGLTVDPYHPLVGIGRYVLGDTAQLSIDHITNQNWPQPEERPVRIIGEAITVGDGDTMDKLVLTVGPDGRLPASVTYTAMQQRLLDRVASLEVR